MKVCLHFSKVIPFNLTGVFDGTIQEFSYFAHFSVHFEKLLTLIFQALEACKSFGVIKLMRGDSKEALALP